MTPIQRAAKKLGGQSAMADRLSVSRQRVHTWVKQGYAPPTWAVRIEDLTGIAARDLLSPRIRSALGRRD